MFEATWPEPPGSDDNVGSSGSSGLRDGEWRQVAILCLSLKDLASLDNRVDREEIRKHLTRAGRRMCEILATYGGVSAAPLEQLARCETVLLTAVFGGQRASENDVERAVQGALALAGFLKRYNRENSKVNIHLEMQAGIHFGWVTSFSDGKVVAQEDAFAVARGLAVAAPADHILVTAEVNRLLTSLFLWEGMGSIYIRGLDEPIPAFRVVGQNSRIEGRWQRSRLVRRSRMVGRESELEVLVSAYNRAREEAESIGISAPDTRSSTSRRRVAPTIVEITGPAGSGKSRLVYEFRRTASPFRDGKASPILARVPSMFPVAYAIFVELLKNFLGVRNSDPPAVRQRKLSAGLAPFQQYEPDLELQAPLFSYLLAVDEHGREEQSGRALQREIHLAFSLLLQAVGRHSCEVLGHPLLLILEDLHGIHELSQNALTGVLECLQCPVPIVLFATHRLAYQLPTELHSVSSVSELRLHKLSDDAQRQMIRSLLDGAGLPGTLEARLLEKSNGNPYYLEELIRTMVLERVLVNEGGKWTVVRPVRHINLPVSLNSLLLSRIDTLPKPTRDLLLRASVVGQDVLIGVLEFIQAELKGPPVRALLEELEEVRFLTPLDIEGEIIYHFENPLVRDVSYQTLGPHNRAVLHRMVGRALEREFKGSLSEQYLELAHHFKKGEDPVKAARYFRLAGEKAQLEYANDLAMSCFAETLELCSDKYECRRVRWRMARVLRILGRPDEARSVLEELVKETRPPLEGTFTFLAEVVLELSRVLRNIGLPREAVELAVRALDLSHRDHDRHGEADALIALGKHLRLIGDRQSAKNAYQHALKILISLGDRAAEGVVYSNLGRLALDRGDLEEAGELFREALKRQKSAGDRWGIALECGHMGEVAYAAGDYPLAEEKFRSCLSQAEPLDIRALVAGCLMYLGAIKARRGEKEGLEEIDDAIEIAETLEDRPRAFRAHQLKAEAFEALGMTAEAEQERQVAEKQADHAGMRVAPLEIDLSARDIQESDEAP